MLAGEPSAAMDPSVRIGSGICKDGTAVLGLHLQG